MTIGQKWKDGLSAKQTEDQRLRETKETEAKRAEAEQFIAKIPGLVEQALAKDQASIRLLPWVRDADVACRDVDKLCESRHPLKSSDLTGVPRIVYDWCENNGLACFLTFGPKIPLNDHDVEMHAKPK